MRKLLPIIACSGLTSASAALPLAGNVHNVPQITVVPEPATNVLLICGLITVSGLAIFLGKKLG